MTDATQIRIALPLPLEVAAALSSAIGTMWPTAVIKADTHSLVMEIPRRPAKRPSKKTLRDMLAALMDDSDPEAALVRWNADGPSIALDHKDEAWQALATWALVALTSEGAPNFVEQTFHAIEPDGTERTFAVTAAWSTGQTPSELLHAANSRIADLEDAIRKGAKP